MRHGKDFLKTGPTLMTSESVTFPGTPLVEICADKRVLIESHQGIVGYRCNEILVKTRIGVISVSGDSLKLCKMSREQLVIHGKISCVSFRGSVK